jgi:hypothetical protein
VVAELHACVEPLPEEGCPVPDSPARHQSGSRHAAIDERGQERVGQSRHAAIDERGQERVGQARDLSVGVTGSVPGKVVEGDGHARARLGGRLGQRFLEPDL